MEIYFISLENTENLNVTELKKLQHNVARKYLKEILANVYNITSEIAEDNGRPYLENDEMFFSISHSNTLIGIAFDKEKTGFDIEFIKPKNYEAILSRLGISDAQNYSLGEFYQMWTIYEAEYKSGIKSELRCFRYKNYICTVSSKTLSEIKFMELSENSFKEFSIDRFMELPDKRILIG